VVKASNDRVKSRKEQVEPMSAVASNSVPSFPAGVDVHWATQRRIVWNELEHTSEEFELVYKISWIAELGLSRSFLRSERKVKG
jgi:hypothetical protein